MRSIRTDSPDRNNRSPLQVFVPENSLPSTIPPERSSQRISTYRRKAFVSSFLPTGVAMRPCSNCIRAGRPDQYKVGGSSNKCLDCVRCGYSNYDLAPFSPVRWTRLQKQRDQKLIEYKNMIAKSNRLLRKVELLEKQQREMVEGEMKNIDDLDLEEQGYSLLPTDFPFNVSSEEIEIPSDFDFAGLAARCW